MKIKKVKLQNFRQHLDREFSFTSGVNVLKGANEAGKTTVTEAIAYALYGTKACRNADITSWSVSGKTKTSAKVSLTLTHNNQEVEITRSKSGATLTTLTRQVTGQSEVTQAVQEVLGFSLEQALSLMFASQMDVRGSLSKGAASANALVNDLADLDIVDTLIDYIQDELPSGNTNHLVTRIEEENLNLSQSRAALTKLESDPPLELYSEETVKLAKESVEALRETYTRTNIEASKSEANFLHKLEVYRKQTQRAKQVSELKVELQNLIKNLGEAPVFDLKEGERLQSVLNNLKQIAQNNELLRKIEEIKAQGVWSDDDLHFIQTQSQKAKHKSDACTVEIKTLSNYLKEFSGKCGFCALDLSLEPKVIKAGKDLKLNQRKQTRLQLILKSLKDQECGISLRNSKIKEHQARLSTVVLDVCELTETETIEALKTWEQQHKKLEDFREAHTRVTQLKSKIDTLNSEYVNVPYPQEDEEHAENLKKTLVKQGKELEDQSKSVEALLMEVAANKEQISEYNQTKRLLQEKIKSDEVQIGKSKASLKEQVSNNEIITYLRTVKPLVAEKLWESVLYFASQYATTLRQEQTTLERETKAFTVNGKAIESLSGSALDMLGLAVRVALTQVFCQSMRTFVLDEPFAACDESRQLLAFGFLKSLGFEQIILVTHDDASEILADNLILV